MDIEMMDTITQAKSDFEKITGSSKGSKPKKSLEERERCQQDRSREVERIRENQQQQQEQAKRQAQAAMETKEQEMQKQKQEMLQKMQALQEQEARMRADKPPKEKREKKKMPKIQNDQAQHVGAQSTHTSKIVQGVRAAPALAQVDSQVPSQVPSRAQVQTASASARVKTFDTLDILSSVSKTATASVTVDTPSASLRQEAHAQVQAHESSASASGGDAFDRLDELPCERTSAPGSVHAQTHQQRAPALKVIDPIPSLSETIITAGHSDVHRNSSEQEVPEFKAIAGLDPLPLLSKTATTPGQARAKAHGQAQSQGVKAVETLDAIPSLETLYALQLKTLHALPSLPETATAPEHVSAMALSTCSPVISSAETSSSFVTQLVSQETVSPQPATQLEDVDEEEDEDSDDDGQDDEDADLEELERQKQEMEEQIRTIEEQHRRDMQQERNRKEEKSHKARLEASKELQRVTSTHVLSGSDDDYEEFGETETHGVLTNIDLTLQNANKAVGGIKEVIKQQQDEMVRIMESKTEENQAELTKAKATFQMKFAVGMLRNMSKPAAPAPDSAGVAAPPPTQKAFRNLPKPPPRDETPLPPIKPLGKATGLPAAQAPHSGWVPSTNSRPPRTTSNRVRVLRGPVVLQKEYADQYGGLSLVFVYV